MPELGCHRKGLKYICWMREWMGLEIPIKSSLWKCKCSGQEIVLQGLEEQLCAGKCLTPGSDDVRIYVYYQFYRYKGCAADNLQIITYTIFLIIKSLLAIINNQLTITSEFCQLLCLLPAYGFDSTVIWQASLYVNERNSFPSECVVIKSGKWTTVKLFLTLL